MLTLITYGSKSTRSPLGDTAPLKDSPLLPSCLKFQKSSAPRKNATSKFSILQPPIIRGKGRGGSYSCFGDFNIHHKDWLTYSDGTNRPGQVFLSSYCTVAFHPLWNTDHAVLSVSIDFLSNSEWDATFHHIAYDYSQADWDGLCDHLRDVPWEDIFKLNASAAAEVQVGIDVRSWNNFWNYQANCVMKYC